MMNFFKQELKTVNLHETAKIEHLIEPEFSESPPNSKRGFKSKVSLRTDQKYSKSRFSSFKSPYVYPALQSKYSHDETKKPRFSLQSLQAS